MKTVSGFVGIIVGLALAGCMETAEFGGSGGTGGGFGGSGGTGSGGGGFGGSGGSSSGNLSLGRDVCVRTAREKGFDVARIESVKEYSFGNNPPRGVEVRMQVRRDPMSVDTKQRVCRFSYANGTADIDKT